MNKLTSIGRVGKNAYIAVLRRSSPNVFAVFVKIGRARRSDGTAIRHIFRTVRPNHIKSHREFWCVRCRVADSFYI